ncbi:hypothetical protein KC207_00300 [Phycicoccus sp. BSK3Z-2]|uniref:Uncharacterized protein n=1 Tax=Phycicoccus avicenniae TaxID=2828860 RepID=A0A941D6L0_9MICO|nr:hypothetical protein [Phycicoccus avicenniae]MBR7741735.1 hypothetical protein [Phycicoccus avicenniae]
MNTTQLLVLVLVVVLAVALVWFLVQRSSGKKDQARAEAAGLRAEAEEVGAGLAGQEAFAAQASERADLARAEADEAARRAADLGAEAEQQQAATDTARSRYEAMLRQADTVDPDVDTPDEPALPPAPEGVAVEPAAGPETPSSTVPPSDAGSTEALTDGSAAPATRAEARRMREEAERNAWSAAPAAPVAGSAVAVRPDVPEDDVDRSARIASAADYRDEDDWEARAMGEPQEVMTPSAGAVPEGPEEPAQPAEPAPSAEQAQPGAPAEEAETSGQVWHTSAPGNEPGMTTSWDDDARSDAEQDTASSEASAEARYSTNDWGGPHDPETDRPDETTDDAVPEGTDRPATDGTSEGASDDGTSSGTQTPGVVETAAAQDDEPVTDSGTASRSTSDDPFDPTPGRDWAADEGTLLEENERRAEDLARDRAEMRHDAQEAGIAGSGLPGEPTAPDGSPATTAAEEEAAATDDVVTDPTTSDPTAPADAAPTTDAPADDATSEDTTADSTLEAETGGAGGEAAVADVSHGEAVEEDEVSASDDPGADGRPAADGSTSEGTSTPTGEPAPGEPDVADEPATPTVGDEQETDDDGAVTTDEPDGGTTDSGATERVTTDDGDTGTTEAPDDTASDARTDHLARAPRRVSDFHEIRDGGYGMGSAAAIDDGAQPLDHPVAAYRDTMSYRLPGDAGYDDAEAHVWFYDAAAAERSGFHRSDG